ncbi:response regulator transcription factor [Qipengyuania sp. MTN3-11]|uniref:response regulator transcription factor n=1 Tax=Qipengyuania sp. MTN3-11 TaxID=3056557 RepID=UPI0036F1F05F
MDTVTIFLTSEEVETFEDFIHDGRRYVFERLASDGPSRLADGPVWIFVDWVMDEMSGLEMCRRLRADSRLADAHVTMMLEGETEDERRRALRAGADDYMLAPLDRTKVLDRVLAVHAPAGQRRATQMIEEGDLRIDLGALQARWAGKPLALQPNEFRLLRFLVENPDRVLSRLALIAGLGKQDPPIDERTVDVWIGRLRRALKAVGAGHKLRTVRSMGYVWDSD